MVERKIPARSLLNFRSPWTEPWDRGFKYITASNLRTKHKKWQDAGADLSQLPAGLPTRGNLVLIGSLATGSGDAGPTPFGTSEPFLQLQATALNDLLQDRALIELPTGGVIVITVAGILLVAMAGRWLRRIPALLLSAALMLIILTLSFGLLVRADIVIPAITATAFMAAAMLAESLRLANLASLEKAFQQADTELTSGTGS
jgi:CHASE2 domain-containing sensor protein